MYRMLNRSKGPAVRGPRAQADRKLYREAMQAELQDTPNLEIVVGGAEDLVLESGCVTGVVLSNGTTLRAGSVVLTTGTFLRGLIHIGPKRIPAGRVGDQPAVGLAKTLDRLALRMGRLKTGTPPRLSGRTIDWSRLEEQPGDDQPLPFSYLNTKISVPQIACHITHTSATAHAVIQEALPEAPLFSGQIEGVGPRYCPSIEDKITRFADKDRHQIFLEPEGLDDDTVYPNGISTSLRKRCSMHSSMQYLVWKRPKFCSIGYAIEYDYVDPTELRFFPRAKKSTRSLSGRSDKWDDWL